MHKEFEKAVDLIKKSKSILVVSHRHPDADTLGANLAMNKIISENSKKVVKSVCIDPVPASLLFLKDTNIIKHKFDLLYFDLIITVDCSSMDQIGFPEIAQTKIPILNIDHHKTNIKYGKLNVVDIEAASATEIVYHLAKILNIKFSPSIATYLLAGIYNDTGSFMHSNTTKKCLEMASDLIRKGASMSQIVTNLFKTNPVEQLRLWGRVLENAKLSTNGAIVSKVTKKDYDETNSRPNDLTGVINYLTSVKNTDTSILLSEDLKGQVKGSLRTNKENIDVSSICAKLGGGGHKKAAGFSIPGKIVSEEVWRIEE